MFRSRLYMEWIQINKENTSNPIEKWARMNRSFVEEEDKKRSTSTGKETNLFSNSIQFSSVTQSCPTLGDPMDCSSPGLPVHHQLPEPTQTQVYCIMMPSNHLILCHPFLLLPSIFPSIGVYSNESVLHIRWLLNYWSSTHKQHSEHIKLCTI